MIASWVSQVSYEPPLFMTDGDGVMALFGAPVAHEDHAQRACYAALSIQKALGEYGEKIKKDTEFEFKMRIGLNSGHVIVGSIGDDLRMVRGPEELHGHPVGCL